MASIQTHLLWDPEQNQQFEKCLERMAGDLSAKPKVSAEGTEAGVGWGPLQGPRGAWAPVCAPVS